MTRFRKLGRHSDVYAQFRTTVSQLGKHERIETTVAKAKAIRRLAVNMVQLGKELNSDDGIIRFDVAGYTGLCSPDNVLRKLFMELPYRYKAGGYTRLLRTPIRVGDAAPMAYIEFINRENELRQSKPPPLDLRREALSIRGLNQSSVHNLHRQKKREHPAGGCAVKRV